MAIEYCERCDGCGWYEGGPTMQTKCEVCDGKGTIRTAEVVVLTPWPETIGIAFEWLRSLERYEHEYAIGPYLNPLHPEKTEFQVVELRGDGRWCIVAKGPTALEAVGLAKEKLI